MMYDIAMRYVRYLLRGSTSPLLGRLEGNDIVGAAGSTAYCAPDEDMWNTISELDGEPVAVGSVRLLPPVDPRKFICIGLNYADHAAEGGNELPTYPLVFGKWTTTICGPHDPITLPSHEPDPDFEIELGVVVGRGARQLDSEAAGWDAIGGYTIVNDVTGRHAQLTDGQWTRGKGYDTFAPVGPCVVRAADFDARNAELGCSIDGRPMQHSNTSSMVFNPGQLVAYLSWTCSLEPGDLIATGTPAGIGYTRSPRVRLEDGQLLESWIQGIGELRNPLRSDPQDSASAIRRILAG
jgi:2-keto-4-pentenoate hydratase/2-oxohepta-3-ene-1,7-dioic acid hydratase in catechol pathway